ncbi:DNA polymerase Y family protein [Massilia sp. YIM B02769]|uniref:Y-family DNA polymerase n=1 Tax=Massilia sp. YIM B02769 TaxID=3050129 RepID=UPI0025B6EA89|nr:DNA polymerase Y family protein [Massilia sp. YIM B02769]MDN4057230.1 DNA polymerase Y family protein [Massilia sp. YIM B02769]
MRLWIGLHLHQLPLEVFSPNWCNDAGSVVLEQERVLAASPAARAAGVAPGMRRGGVLVLMPDVRLHVRSPEREAEALNTAALALLQYTPLVAVAEESTLLIDIGASLRLFGGIRALCRRVRASLRALGYSGVLSCAPTARGAWMLARRRAGRAMRIESLTRRLDSLPASLPPPARAYATWFEGIGCFSLGAMRRLPRPGLQRRCGRALLDMLDAAYGMAPELFEWVEAPTSFHARIELFDRLENAEECLMGAERLVQQLTGWLCAHQLAVERITLLLEHERGRVARPPTPVDIALAEPTWHDAHLVRLLRERLAKLTLEAPVIALALDANQVQPMAPPNESLFPEPGGSEEDRLRMFELLIARLGPDNVLQALPQADYRPEVANNWVPVQEKVRETVRASQMPPDVESLARPTWILAKPIALLMRNHRPFYGSPLKMASEAERIEAGWWSQTQTRDYFIAEGQDHTLYWVYRERIVGSGEDEAPRWYLHGLFG